ncbi:MAG: NAD(P)-binding domain-containing protein [Bacteroidia bacterium]
MNIAVFGTGNVGTTIGTRLVGLGHQVMMGSRTADNEKARAWVAQTGAGASQGTYAEAAAFGELVFICTRGDGTLPALEGAAAHLGDKILIDISNPLDLSQGFPPSLFVSNTDSLGEQIQRAFPAARVVKTLNTMWCGIMVQPRMLPEAHVVFLSGNDADAKAIVADLLRSFGWQDEEILDLGDISTARGTESLLPVWLRIYMATQSGAFNFKIVKAN